MPQIPLLVLPQVWVTGAETETVADLVTHVSVDLPTQYLGQKLVHVLAMEIVVAGVPGNLQMWIELSPYASSLSTAYWGAIGGGGGALPPVAPQVLAATGVNLTIHNILIPWVIDSAYARLVIQTPVAGALPGAFWVVQALFNGKIEGA